MDLCAFLVEVLARRLTRDPNVVSSGANITIAEHTVTIRETRESVVIVVRPLNEEIHD